MPVLARDLTLALTPGAASMTTECEGNNRELDSDAPWPCDFVPGQMVRARARHAARRAMVPGGAAPRGLFIAVALQVGPALTGGGACIIVMLMMMFRARLARWSRLKSCLSAA